MRVLLSSIGSRGEVQPLVALALRLREAGHDVRACVPPDFQDWIEGLGIPVTPIGPSLRPTAAPTAAVPFTAEQRLTLIEGTVAAQFATIRPTAQGCDVMIGCGALQVAGPSVAELVGLRYFHAHYCPISLPSPHHAPPPLGFAASGSFVEQWAADAARWNEHWRGPLNAQRAAAGLAPVDDVRSHIFTDRPWLAADPLLGPWPGSPVFQPGAWLLPDESPLPAALEAFLDRGEPPVHFGLGSMRAPGADVGRVMLDAARATGRRAIVSRGWAGLPLSDEGKDCIVIDEVNHRALFPRVAAVVHHGGAGTTATIARAGTAQVVIPQLYDQHYWAARVAALGIGVAHAPGMPGTASLSAALAQALDPAVTARAGDLAPRIDTNGTARAAAAL